jgi:hypothetical protein
VDTFAACVSFEDDSLHYGYVPGTQCIVYSITVPTTAVILIFSTIMIVVRVSVLVSKNTIPPQLMNIDTQIALCYSGRLFHSN